jgi:uncharacterized protein YfaS (alpha-2-macroglobulin family)
VAHYQGDKLNAALSASWLSGGGLSGAPYTWFITREPAWFSPGAASGSGGSVWRNWRFGPELNDGRSYIGQGEGNLGPDGKATISSETRTDGIEGAAYSYRIETSVQDAARQEITGRDSVLVHPSSFYIAARIDSGTLKNAANAGGGGTGAVPSFAASDPSAYFLSADRPATLSWALVSPEGSAWLPSSAAGLPLAASDLSIKLIRHEWKQAKQAGIGGRINLIWERVEEIVEERSVKIEAPSGRNAAAFISGVFNFTPDKSGLWEVRIQGQDQKERIAATRFRFYVSGAGWVRWGSDDVDAISLTTDRDSYAPGETAKILVRSPLERGKYLLTLEREGIISQRIIELEGSALSIDIPIEESYLPIVYAAISSYTVRSGPPQNTYYEPDLDKPKGIFGVTPIYISHESRNYQIDIEPSKGAYRPAEEAEVRLKVSLNGKPAPSTEVSFMAVDRGVVDLINYHVPDPVRFFYDPGHFPLGVRGADSRSLLIDPVTYGLSDLQPHFRFFRRTVRAPGSLNFNLIVTAFIADINWRNAENSLWFVQIRLIVGVLRWTRPDCVRRNGRIYNGQIRFFYGNINSERGTFKLDDPLRDDALPLQSKKILAFFQRRAYQNLRCFSRSVTVPVRGQADCVHII